MALNIFITGGASGIGYGIAESLASEGHHLIIADINLDAAESAAQKLKDEGHSAQAIEVNVCDAKQVAALPEKLGDVKVDVLINNAGVGRGYGNLVEAHFDDIEKTIDTNVKAAIYAVRAVLPGMVQRNSGHIINIGSMAGLYPLASSLYGATKGAMHVLSMDLRLELQGTGVRVTEICPGRVSTEFYDAALDDPEVIESKKNSGIEEVTSEDISQAVIYALNASQHVNINRIELQPTEQTYGGMQFTPRSQK